jgi:hypothetical protein
MVGCSLLVGGLERLKSKQILLKVNKMFHLLFYIKGYIMILFDTILTL